MYSEAMSETNTPHTPDSDSVASAARALADATATLTRLLGVQVGAISDDVGGAVAVGLREASRGLKLASESLARTAETPGPSRRERADQTRTDLLDAMARVVAARGYEGASVGDVAADAGYTKGAVYAGFGSKEDLFVHLARREQAEGRLVPVPGVGPTPAGDPDPKAALLGLEVIAYAVRHASARADLRELLAEQLASLALTARDARAAREGGDTHREPPSEADRDTAAGLVAVTVVAGLLTGLPDGDLADPGTAERLVGRLLAG